MNKRNTVLIIAIISFIILLASGTYAWVSFNATINNENLVAGTTHCFLVDYTGLDIPLNGTLWQSTWSVGSNYSFEKNDWVGDYGSGINGSFTMKVNSECDVDSVGTVYLNVASTTSSKLYSTVSAHCENPFTLNTLKQYTTSSACTTAGYEWVTNGTALKYALTGTGHAPAVGYVNKTGDITVLDNIPLSTDDRDFKIYIWLDGNLADSSYSNLSFNGSVHLGARQVETYTGVIKKLLENLSQSDSDSSSGSDNDSELGSDLESNSILSEWINSEVDVSISAKYVAGDKIGQPYTGYANNVIEVKITYTINGEVGTFDSGTITAVADGFYDSVDIFYKGSGTIPVCYGNSNTECILYEIPTYYPGYFPESCYIINGKSYECIRIDYDIDPPSCEIISDSSGVYIKSLDDPFSAGFNSGLSCMGLSYSNSSVTCDTSLNMTLDYPYYFSTPITCSNSYTQVYAYVKDNAGNERRCTAKLNNCAIVK